MRLNRYVLVFVTVLASLRAWALADSVTVSLLTCAPGTEVYQLYGHTALRVVDPKREMDAVFNYGVFDFNTPHFTWRFVLGQCDYMLYPYPFAAFMEEYRQRGSQVTEQILNLTPDEAMRLYLSLAHNALPEYRTYRYNFLLNNCTTKARDMIEQAVDGRVVYPERGEERLTGHKTYREMLHHYTHDYPWSETGNDLLLGAACDTILVDRASQFLPEELMQAVEGAMIYDSLENRRPLVKKVRTLSLDDPSQRAVHGDMPWYMQIANRFTPAQCAWTLFVLCLLVMVAERHWRRMWWGVDLLLLTFQGVTGMLLTFMFLFSQHPTMDSNWQVWVFNPLPLLCMPWVVRSAIRRKRCAYHNVAAPVLLLFVVCIPWLPQCFSAPMLPLALALLTREVSYLINRK